MGEGNGSRSMSEPAKTTGRNFCPPTIVGGLRARQGNEYTPPRLESGRGVPIGGRIRENPDGVGIPIAALYQENSNGLRKEEDLSLGVLFFLVVRGACPVELLRDSMGLVFFISCGMVEADR